MATIDAPDDLEISMDAANLMRLAAYQAGGIPFPAKASSLITRKSVAKTMLYDPDPATRELAWKIISGEES
jgi:hypothetical protein